MIAGFNRNFIRSGELPERLFGALRDGFDQRFVADYEYREMIPMSAARTLVERAEDFLNTTEEYLRRGEK